MSELEKLLDENIDKYLISKGLPGETSTADLKSLIKGLFLMVFTHLGQFNQLILYSEFVADPKTVLDYISNLYIRDSVWRSSAVVVVGQVMYPTNPTSSLAFECIKAGTTGTTEPTGIVMQAVTDGSAKWGIFDIRKRTPELDGSFELKNWTTPKRGYHVANGATLTNLSANHPSLYRALQDGEVLFVDTNAWSDISVSNPDGVVPYFGYDGGDTCILPDVRNMYLRASGTYNPQDYHGDAIRNITGGLGFGTIMNGNVYSSGAFSSSAGTSSTYIGAVQMSGLSQHVNLNVGNTVPVASENRVKSIIQLPVIFTGYKVV